eukprot:1152881-Pelagomonas_calceolata.AAC.6
MDGLVGGVAQCADGVGVPSPAPCSTRAVQTKKQGAPSPAPYSKNDNTSCAARMPESIHITKVEKATQGRCAATSTKQHG